ncbi:hypothetical protein [Pseudoalteromonas sp. T1lg88]|uniref:hypothetical protein n=1 Tax=Pseudoalteromonas sp. T1lg88 TaxID=2077104 RepID=UPI001319EFFA|nr:hypothetical protein [Pseudoalteromonas sp. T1lg88]
MMAKQNNLEALFDRALDGEQLSADEMAALSGDPVFGPMLKQAEYWQGAAEQFAAQNVPQSWQAERLFPSTPASSQYFPWVAASIMSFAMLFGGYQVYGTNQQLVAQIQQQEQTLAEQKQQMQQLSEALVAQSQWQKEALADIATQTVDIARSERQDAMATLVDYINTQRAQDNAYLRMQLNDIAEQIEQQPPYSTAYNTESQ